MTPQKEHVDVNGRCCRWKHRRKHNEYNIEESTVRTLVDGRASR